MDFKVDKVTEEVSMASTERFTITDYREAINDKGEKVTVEAGKRTVTEDSLLRSIAQAEQEISRSEERLEALESQLAQIKEL